MKQEYSFDIDGHTIVKEVPSEKEEKMPAKDWLDQALNEGDGVYRS